MLRIVTDQFRHPTLADDLARALLLLFEKKSGPASCTRPEASG